jgi:hypothetical protein
MAVLKKLNVSLFRLSEEEGTSNQQPATSTLFVESDTSIDL